MDKVTPSCALFSWGLCLGVIRRQNNVSVAEVWYFARINIVTILEHDLGRVRTNVEKT